jgi:hypothetical protein
LRYEAFTIPEYHTDEGRGGCADVSPIEGANSILEERPEFWVVEDFRGGMGHPQLVSVHMPYKKEGRREI